MSALQSAVNVTTPAYTERHAEMQQLVSTLHERLALAARQGPKKAIERHLASGQLLARDRVELLLDEDSPFLELMPLAGWGQEDDGMTLGGSVVVGIGLVEGVMCMILANVPTLAGGASNEVTVLKSLRSQEIALENRLPVISLVQTVRVLAPIDTSAGANLQQQSRVFHRGGASFRNIARLSKAGIPSVAVVFGSSTAGGAYQPGMSDYTIMVAKRAKVFLGGPPLVFAATGEKTTDEELGGADMHSRISGVSDALAADEHHALSLARDFVRRWKAKQAYERLAHLPQAYWNRSWDEPLYSADELLGVVSANVRVPFEAREVIARIVDGSRFTEFKPLYGPNLVAGFAAIHDMEVGILGNNNCLLSPEANKATQFINLCNMKACPLIFLHNITGFMVGKKYEEEGIIKAGSRFINAVANSQVPAIGLMTGASYGAGNYAMCGRAYAPRFLFSWPNSKCSVMGPEQLANVMETVSREAAAKARRTVDEEQLAARTGALRALVEEESDCYYTSSRTLDDGIIDPRDTRTVLGMCLTVVYSQRMAAQSLAGVSRM
ncbi:hypothetical protein RI367_005819 [Sorochytrium milnesiophthora]